MIYILSICFLAGVFFVLKLRSDAKRGAVAQDDLDELEEAVQSAEKTDAEWKKLEAEKQKILSNIVDRKSALHKWMQWRKMPQDNPPKAD